MTTGTGEEGDFVASSLTLQAPRKLSWVSAVLPPLRVDEMLVRTRTGSVSVGTELPLYTGKHRPAAELNYPLQTGYESVGEVVACGAEGTGFQVGDRVLSFYGHKTHAVIPADRAIPVPEAVPDSLALLAILGCDTAKGVNKIKPLIDQKVLICGAGTIGLLTLFNLKARGVKTVDVIEPVAYRRELARLLGAEQVIPPAEVQLPGDNYTVGFECSSYQAGFEILQQHMAPGGRICVLSDGNTEPFLLAPAFHAKELTVIASSDGEDYGLYSRWFFEQARRISSVFEKFYEVQTPHTDLPEVFEQIALGNISPVKVLVHYLPV